MEHGVGYVATWLDPRVLEVTATKDGRAVSPNGRTLTVSYETAPPNGTAQTEHRLVFNRMRG